MENIRKLAAIVFSDIVDCTKTMSKDEKLGFEYIKKHSSLVKEHVSKYNGELLKELGDGCLLIFNSAYDALKFSENLQKNINNHEQFKVRIGIHVGDVVKESDDYFGSGVNIASRIYNFASPGEICITQDVFSQVRSYKDVNTQHLGNKSIKGIDQKVDIYKISTEETQDIDDKENKVSILGRLIEELKRRNVLKTMGVYAAAAFIIIQVSEIVFPRLFLPDWTVTFIIVLVLIGFPITFFLSWTYNVYPNSEQQTIFLPDGSLADAL